MPQWRQAQLKHKKAKQRAGNLIGAGFLLLIIFLAGISVLISQAKDSIWDGRSVIGVVYQQGNEVKLKAWLPEYKQIYEWPLPGNSMVEVPRNFGQYQLRNVFRLGELDKHGGELLMRAAQNHLGVPVAGWEVDWRSNLTWWDKARLLVLTWFYRQGEAKGGELLFDQKIIDEGLSVAILNASGVEGEAKTVSRILANLGAEVRMVTNWEKQAESEIVVVEKSRWESETVKKIGRALKINKIRVGQVTDGRADIAVIIAVDYTQVY